jgi:CRP-like cAMP-binding protein
LFKEGDAGDRLFVVVEGKLKLGTSSGDGRENLLSILGPGDMFGELSLFDPGPRTATATAVTDARVLALANDQVIGWVTAHPQVSLQLLKRLARRLRRTNEVLADLVFADVPGRVAKAIMDLGERFGTKKDDGLHVNHELTQEELAQLVGASRETVNKALADFAGRGWVRLEPRAVVVLDYERLSKRGR